MARHRSTTAGLHYRDGTPTCSKSEVQCGAVHANGEGLYPYLYADKDNWPGLLNLSDDDPHFEAFLRASFATVNLPVYRDSQKETAAINFIMNNSIADYETVPAGMQSLLDELNGQPTKFTTGLNGETVAPTEVVDLGIFPMPTDLVILECGFESGVKPIGFPQTEPDTTHISIPKQY